MCQQIEEGDKIGANYEYLNRAESKKKGDEHLFTRSRFMHTNLAESQANGHDDCPKRTIDHTEELETLKTSIGENEEAIEQLEAQLKKLDESIKKVSDELVR